MLETLLLNKIKIHDLKLNNITCYNCSITLFVYMVTKYTTSIFFMDGCMDRQIYKKILSPID